MSLSQEILHPRPVQAYKWNFQYISLSLRHNTSVAHAGLLCLRGRTPCDQGPNSFVKPASQSCVSLSGPLRCMRAWCSTALDMHRTVHWYPTTNNLLFLADTSQRLSAICDWKACDSSLDTEEHEFQIWWRSMNLRSTEYYICTHSNNGLNLNQYRWTLLQLCQETRLPKHFNT